MKYKKEIIDKAINDYINGNKLKEISLIYSIPERTLARYISKAGVKKIEIIDKNIINKAIIDYIDNNLTATECAKKYNIGRTTLLRHLEKYDIEKNYTTTKREYNRDYFEVIDTEEKAYWLGFIAADGCITRMESNLDIGLQYSDRNHLVKFINSINGDIDMINDKTVKCSLNNKSYESSRLTIGSKKMCQDLIRLGLGPRKSSILNFPTNIPKELMRHYLRGYFDGDGCITSNNGVYQISIIATNDFLNDLKEFLLNLNMTKTKLEQRNSNMAVWKKKGRNQIKIFLDYIYKDSTIYLDRKYNKYLEFCRLEPKLQKTQDD